MLKVILQTVGVVLALVLLLNLIFWLYKLMLTTIFIVVGILMVVGVVFLTGLFFKMSLKKEQSKPKFYTVAAYNKQPAVALFMSEPSLNQLVNAENVSHITEWALNGSVLEIDNETQVIVLDDAREKQAVHVRVSNGQFQGRDGWVSRSSLKASNLPTPPEKPEKKLLWG